MKWTILILTIVLFVALTWHSAKAEGFHVDFAVALHDPELDTFVQSYGRPISFGIGEVEISYEWENGSAIFIRHNSSLEQADTGLNMIGIKARLF